MSEKKYDTDYKLIPMHKITDEARELAVRWGDEYFPGFGLSEKHKLASDIMNYARRNAPPSTAQRCPICGGNGLVPNGFYSQTSGASTTNGTDPDKCRSCGGAGVVWEKKKDKN